MRTKARSLMLAPVLLVAPLLIAAPAGAASWHARGTHALFVQTDQPNNAVLSYVRQDDGTLQSAGTYLTGGHGAIAQGATADPLASQGSLALADEGRTLLAVNAGSNSVSAFAVHGASLRLVQTVGSGGAFPASISVFGDEVFVLDAGGAGAVAGFWLDHGRLRAIPGDVRTLGLTNATPPNFLASPGQVGVTPDGAHVVVTTKASTSSFEVFGLHHGVLGASPTVTPSSTPVPFAFVFRADGLLVAAEAGASSVSTYRVQPSGALSPVGSVGDGGTALCWIAADGATYYGSNAGSATLSSFTATALGTPSLAKAVAAATHPGTTDAAVAPDGAYLYVESGGSGALDAFAVLPGGALQPVETLFTLPVGAEGIAAT